MKKSVCLMAIIGAFGISAANAGSQSFPIDFHGEVTNQNCKVDLIGGGTTLDLGTIQTSLGDGKTGPVVPMFFKLSGCNAVTGVTAVALKNDLIVDPQYAANSNAGQHTLSTDHPHVVVKIFQDKDGTTPGLTAIPKPIPVAGDATIIKAGYAAMVVKKTGADPLKAQEVNARAMFTLTYQ